MTQLQSTVHEECLGTRYLMMGSHRGQLECFGLAATLQDAMDTFNARYTAAVHGDYTLEWTLSSDVVTDEVFEYQPVWTAWDGTCTTQYFIMPVTRIEVRVQ